MRPCSGSPTRIRVRRSPSGTGQLGEPQSPKVEKSEGPVASFHEHSTLRTCIYDEIQGAGPPAPFPAFVPLDLIWIVENARFREVCQVVDKCAY